MHKFFLGFFVRHILS